MKGNKIKDKKTEKNLIVTEAEHIILDYIEKINQKEISHKRKYLENKNKVLKITNIIFIVAFILALFG